MVAAPGSAVGMFRFSRSRGLVEHNLLPTFPGMWKREQWLSFIDLPWVEWSMFVLGVILIILSPVAGVIPGPGGIFIFAIGLALVLKTSMWAKRRYVHFKRWQPKVGRWADWGLRRRSVRRREALRKEQESAGDSQLGQIRETGPS